MGKNLHPTIMPFVTKRIQDHSAVHRIEDISTEDDFIFKVIRRNGLRDVIVLISDAYYFSDFDYLSKPNVLDDGGIVLIAKPEAHFSDDSQNNYLEDKVIIGKIGVALGALRKDDFWTYEKPEKKLEK
jgi:hypothetical protein